VNARLFGEAFVTLFVIMDPVGTIPIFLSLTGGRSVQVSRRLAWQAVLVSFGVISAFAFFGQQILSYLHISLPALQCAGGLLLLLVAGVVADVDGPPLKGEPFIDRWREDSLVSLFTFIRTKMPQDSPGKLSESTYLDLLAYLLQTNGNPAGPVELTTASLPTTLLVGRDGPKPLPTNALVRLVGCLTPGAGNTWTVARAAEPERTREGEQTTPEELKSAAAKPLGAKTFRLQNLTELQPAINPEGWKGHKVQAKGVLIRQTNNDRINVISLMTVAPDCGP